MLSLMVEHFDYVWCCLLLVADLGCWFFAVFHGFFDISVVFFLKVQHRQGKLSLLKNVTILILCMSPFLGRELI